MKQIAVMTGLAIGDALGQPFEFCNHEQITKADWQCEYRAGEACGVPLQAGQWTDDCKMAICIAQSLIDNGSYDVNDVASRYVKWYNSGDLRGIGVQTARALQNMITGVPLLNCGEILKKSKPSFRRDGQDTNVCGNGTAMRIAPLGVFFREDQVKIFKHSIQDAALTHNHQDAKDASLVVAYLSGLLGNNINPLEAVEETAELITGDNNVKQSLTAAIRLAGESKKWDDALILGTDGTAHQTVGSAIFCFLRYIGDGFKSVVVNSVRMGGDTDTRGAIAGALAGAYLGKEGIPEEYLDDLEHTEFLDSLDCILSLGPQRIKNIK